MQTTRLTAKNLSKKYGTREVVSQLDISVEAGSFTALLGTNGAGKSTTIGMLTTLVQPTSGEIYYDGLVSKEHLPKVRAKVGIVFQDSLLDGALSVLDNLKIQAGLYKNIPKERIDEVIKLTKLTALSKQKVSHLSGGQRRRVDIATSILHQPDILFLDEPTTGLDIQTRLAIWEMLEGMRQTENLTIFLTTHYLDEANFADNVYIIDDGKLIANGSAQALIQTYTKENLQIEAGQLSDICRVLGLSEEKFPMIIPVADAQAAISILNKIQPYVTTFTYQHGTMNEVFVALTGKEMTS
ncbi:ABC transporter ATP-binding protein [Lactococcus carnosus]|uniref:ABC transporter ATP-binding protein n=1 Tax=Pseudolactococcus carnosus TaxID=2749961 RepID=A0ABT0AS95_9LACT|nr:ABC transporter ATP-binding protein [Lactococcus carnosus]MCJ1969235.1 ABC transporter ATP-binding protein [Lactococcus carnosus]MCJ1989588.1 ABC transporter ATP-binding protein [Lactococcus carnosus]MCJ1992757.1 ABC transporter ATP-binding protein [Lactococcus carnosus]SCA91321.1 putative ABC-type multidrug transport system, ATP binding protein, Nod factor export [Lactococcus piscium]